MRKIYLILNTLFIIAIITLLDAYASSIQGSNELSGKNKQIRKKVKKNKRKASAESITPDENLVAILNDSNLFEVNRGQEIVSSTGKSSGSKNNSNFKLMGVCHFGEAKGAIITSSSSSKDSSKKTYFTIGEEVGNGYKLYDVAAKNVVLTNGSKKINLELAKDNSKPPRPSRATSTRRTSRRRTRTLKR
jgi:Type II secretion system protein C